MMNFVFARSALLIGITSLGLFGQVPINDSLVVTFPSEVQVGRQVLPAGEYTIRQLNTSSSPRLLEFSTNKGTAIQASATAIAVVDSNNVNDSSVVLETRGGVQYVHRIWIKGKSYGYEFPVSGANDAELASASSLRLDATYATTATPRAADTGAADTTAAVTPSTNSAVAATPSPNAVVAESSTADRANREQPEAGNSQLAEPAQQAQQPEQPERPQQSQQAQQPQPGGQPQQTEPSVTSAPQQSAPPVPSSTPLMPDTALNWMGLVGAGAGLIASGLFLRAGRRRA